MPVSAAQRHEPRAGHVVAEKHIPFFKTGKQLRAPLEIRVRRQL